MRVVILGGGYGGLRAIEKLVKLPDTELVLVDKNGYHYLQTEVYGYIAGTRDIDELAIDLQAWCDGYGGRVRFVKSEILGVEPESKRVVLEKESLSYDILIVATGARTRFPDAIEGLRRHGFGVKHLHRAFLFRHLFEAEIERKVQGESEKVEIVVAGAGLSGVEVAAEMAHTLKRYAKTLGAHEKEIRVTLLDACDTILPGMHPKIVAVSKRRLASLKVRIRTGAYIEKVEERQLVLKNGESLPYTFIIFTGGITANSGFFQAAAKNGIGQLEVDPWLKIPGTHDIYAIGDVADIRDSRGDPLPPTAQIAEKSAEYVAKAVAARQNGRSVPPFRGRIDGMFIALGGRYGAAEIFGIRFHGMSAYWFKKLVTFVYRLGISLRANTAYRIRS
ncbi:NAD(P)/FAD-dependent oxidoreductase [Hydrogenimonas sp. SS33]|uniref:NAD(P)/FAD-dependent oxidoreductase n=1 Tax=Hydrogenimonas leucolamina TaxID=2954236 RepID=UPI00336BEBF3